MLDEDGVPIQRLWKSWAYDTILAEWGDGSEPLRRKGKVRKHADQHVKDINMLISVHRHAKDINMLISVHRHAKDIKMLISVHRHAKDINMLTSTKKSSTIFLHSERKNRAPAFC